MINKHYGKNKLPFIGFGLGLRTEHYEDVLAQNPDVDWFEITTENYLVPGGKPLYYLDKIRQSYPLIMHGVSLSLGSCDPLDENYLKQIKQLVNHIEPTWVSDHLCWTGVNGFNLHDLLPLPYTKEAVNHVVSRIQQVQDYLRRPLLIENVSSYLTYQESEMSEWQFIKDIVKKSGCYILLDVNNVYVSAKNHNFNPMDYINAMPKDSVAQIHLAGHSDEGFYIIDTHDAPVSSEVWSLYEKTIRRLGPVTTMIERDDNIPPFSEMLDELNHARKISAWVEDEALTT